MTTPYSGAAPIPPPTPTPVGDVVTQPNPVSVDRGGRVTVNGDGFGYVDRFDHTGRRKPDWRWVRDGGASSRQRFKTRRDAVQALVAGNGWPS